MSSEPRLERYEEAEFLRLIKKHKLPVKTRKMNGLGCRDWPDRLIIGPYQFTLWIEFKRKERGKVSPGQAILFKELQDMYHVVYIFDDGKEAFQFLQQKLDEHALKRF